MGTFKFIQKGSYGYVSIPIKGFMSYGVEKARMLIHRDGGLAVKYYGSHKRLTFNLG